MLFIATYAYSTVYSQVTEGITFIMNKKDGKVVTRNAQEQKVFDFFVTGLGTNEDVDAFTAEFKKMKFVIDITISNELIDNKRTGTAIFHGDATRQYIRNALIYSGVKHVVIDDKTINAEDFNDTKSTITE